MRFLLSQRANADLDDLTNYGLDAFGERTVLWYGTGLEYLFELLADNPRLGHSWNDDHGIRRHRYRSHWVYYTIQEGDLPLILSIVHTKRSAPSIDELL